MAEAKEILENNQIDGCVSDVFFPEDENSTADTFENALTINQFLKERGIWHVFNTAGNHHGKKYRDFLHKTPYWPLEQEREEELEFLESGCLLESYPEEYDEETHEFIDLPYKQWRTSYQVVCLALYFLAKDDLGIITLAETELRSYGYGDYGQYMSQDIKKALEKSSEVKEVLDFYSLT